MSISSRTHPIRTAPLSLVRRRSRRASSGRPGTDDSRPGHIRRPLVGWRARAESPRILLVDPDPHLAFLLRFGFPKAELVEADSRRDPVPMPNGLPDLVIVDLEGPGAAAFLARHPKLKVIGIAEGTRLSGSAEMYELQALLLRPLAPAELFRAIRRALGVPERAMAPGVGQMERVHRWIGPFRLGAAAFAALLQIAASSVPAPRAAVVSAVLVYCAIRLMSRRMGLAGALCDIGVAGVAVALTGGVQSSYAVLGIAASFEAGLVLGSGVGPLAALIVAAGSAPSIVSSSGFGVLRLSQLVAWFALFPLAALTGALSARISRSPERTGAGLLTEANRVLSSLFRIARTIPGGFDLGIVASSALEELRSSLDAPAGVLLLREAGIVTVAGAFGLPDAQSQVLTHEDVPHELLGGRSQVLAGDEAPGWLAGVLAGHACWIAAPLRRDGLVSGMLLAACAHHSRHRASRSVLQELAEDTAVAVENVRLFARVRELSADEERRRLARELHDGVAQALTHVRMELEILGRNGTADAAVRWESERLARVVGRAVADVRATIDGLRSGLASDGLIRGLRTYLRDLQSLGGPEIVLEAKGVPALELEVEAEVFRIAQEAVANALRHAQPSRVEIRIEASSAGVRLTVEDDGVGIHSAARRSSGMGLEGMRERAQRLGGHLYVRGRSSGGTRVELILDAWGHGVAEAPAGAARTA